MRLDFKITIELLMCSMISVYPYIKYLFFTEVSYL
jgi:hypothetical protein